MSEHECIVCLRAVSTHGRCERGDDHFPRPCCPGCPCGSFADAHPTSESVPQQGIVDGDPRPVLSTEPLNESELEWYRDYANRPDVAALSMAVGFRRLLATLDAERAAVIEAFAAAHRPHRPDCALDRFPGNYAEPPDPCTCGLDDLLAALTSEAHRG